MENSYLNGIAEMELPHTRTEIACYMKFLEYYREHEEIYPRLWEPWRIMLEKYKREEGETIQAEQNPQIDATAVGAFEEAKGLLSSTPRLEFPNLKEGEGAKFTLSTNYYGDIASHNLTQTKGDRRVVIAYGTRRLATLKNAKSEEEKEIVTGLYWMTKHQYYLKWQMPFVWDAKITLETLRQTIEGMNHSKRSKRICNELSDYYFEL